MWIAKDLDNSICVYENKPIKIEAEGIWKDLPFTKTKVTDTFTKEQYDEILKWGDSKPLLVALISYESLNDIVQTVLDKTNLSTTTKSEIMADMLMHDFYLSY